MSLYLPDEDIFLPNEQLLEFICHHQGIVTLPHLTRAGYTRNQIAELCQQQVLTKITEETYCLNEHLAPVFLDPLIQVQWSIPEGIFGATTALRFHRIVAALPFVSEVCVPSNWQGVIPSGFDVHTFILPPDLRTYGVMKVYPPLPGDIPVAMYSSAVAAIQTLIDEEADPQIREECIWMYRSFFGDEEALQEAAQFYQVELPNPHR